MGYIANVTAATPIASTWGNQIRDRVTMVFDSIADRSAQWTSPPDGAMSFITDVNQLHVFSGGVWNCITPVADRSNTAESISGAGYGTLSIHPGPEVSLLTGTRALVTVTCQMDNGGGGGECHGSFAISGATGRAAQDEFGVTVVGAGVVIAGTVVSVVESLTPGINTFTMQFRASSGTNYTARRQITVVGLP